MSEQYFECPHCRRQTARIINYGYQFHPDAPPFRYQCTHPCCCAEGSFKLTPEAARAEAERLCKAQDEARWSCIHDVTPEDEQCCVICDGDRLNPCVRYYDANNGDLCWNRIPADCHGGIWDFEDAGIYWRPYTPPQAEEVKG